tara:strand:- start:115 stop:345 length:231 start_codon:yes stop_codon:yes gene_type:complete
MLRLGDLVRIRENVASLGIVIEECSLERDVMHPLSGMRLSPAVKIKWLDNQAGPERRREERVYYESALELLERGKG